MSRRWCTWHLVVSPRTVLRWHRDLIRSQADALLACDFIETVTLFEQHQHRRPSRRHISRLSNVKGREEDIYEISVRLSASDLVFLDAYAQMHSGEQADVEISDHTRPPEARRDDRSAGIRDALQLLRRVRDGEQERGDNDAWYEHREARGRV